MVQREGRRAGTTAASSLWPCESAPMPEQNSRRSGRSGINGNPRRRLVGGFVSRCASIRPLVPANNDLAARHELLAYRPAVKRACDTGNLQSPVAHSCAPERLNRHSEGQAAGNDEAATEHDEL